MALEAYLKSNPLMDIKLSGLSEEDIEFNTVDECMWNTASLESQHEVISGKIAFVNGLLENFRDLLLKKKAEMKHLEAKTWIETKNTSVDANDKALSDKRVDMVVDASQEVVDLNDNILDVAKNVRRLEIFVIDLRGAKIAMETVLKTRVI